MRDGSGGKVVSFASLYDRVRHLIQLLAIGDAITTRSYGATKTIAQVPTAQSVDCAFSQRQKPHSGLYESLLRYWIQLPYFFIAQLPTTVGGKRKAAARAVCAIANCAFSIANDCMFWRTIFLRRENFVLKSLRISHYVKSLD